MCDTDILDDFLKLFETINPNDSWDNYIPQLSSETNIYNEVT